MDEVIFEEFKGTGNSEVVLSRNAANKKSLSQLLTLQNLEQEKEELLLTPDVLQKTWILRNAISQMDEVEALKFLYSKMQKLKIMKIF